MGKKITEINSKPLILFEGTYTDRDVRMLKSRYRVWHTHELYDQQSEEVFKITHPSLLNSSDYQKQCRQFIHRRNNLPFNKRGNWVYCPWNGNLIHSVNAKEYFLLRTNRNKNIITETEQQRLYSSCIGIIGLSVGGSLAVGMAYQGIGGQIKLAEFDRLETTNLNRLRAGLHHVGLPKITIAAQQIYEVDPYVHLHLFPTGLDENNVSSFVSASPKPRVVFEIIDDFAMKIKLRLAARASNVPVISMANLADSILIDVERYDSTPNLSLFNGVIGKLPETILQHPEEDKHKYAVALVGKHNVPAKALSSVALIGKTLVGRPQVSSTVTVSAGLGAYFARKIILNEHLPSGRYRIEFSKFF